MLGRELREKPQLVEFKQHISFKTSELFLLVTFGIDQDLTETERKAQK